MGQSGGSEAVTALGLAMYQHRLARGLSLRVLARQLGLSGHGGLLEYERGRRIPPEDVVVGCERVLGIDDGRLVALRDRALAERAAAKTAERQEAQAHHAIRAPVDGPTGTPDAGGHVDIAGRAEAVESGKAMPVALAQLPADVADFTGRDREIAELVAPTTSSIVVISGKPGVGKTTLAVHVAHLLITDHPDAQFYCDLRGVHDPAQPAEVLATVLRALGVTDAGVPASTEERAALYRSLLHDRRAVVVLDNAADEAQVRPLLPGGPRCVTLVTSRSRLSGLSGVHRVPLDVPGPDETLRLLAEIVGRQRIDAALPAAGRLAEACGRLPLAVRIAGNRLAAWPQWTVEYLTERLADERSRLAWLRAGDLEVRAAFAVSHDALAPTARRMFQLLSLVPGPDFGAEMAAILTDIPVPDAEVVLDDLAAVSLVEPAVIPGRYRLHDLLRLYADERLRAEQDDGQRAHATDRMVTWLLDTAIGASATIAPPSKVVLDPGDRFACDRAAAIAWLDAERSNMLGAATRADPALVIRFLDHVVWYLDLRCAWSDLRQLSELAQSVTSDLAAAALAWNSLGLAFWGMGEYAKAVSSHQRAAELAHAAGSLTEEGTAYDRLGMAQWGLNQFVAAIRNHERAIELCRRSGDRWSEASALNHVGRAHYYAGRFAEASDCHQQATARLAALGDVRGEAYARQALGCALAGLGRYDEARECHERALEVFLVVGDPWAAGTARQGLGVALRGLGQPEAALDHLGCALALFEAAPDPLWQAHTHRALGDVLADLGDPVAARSHRQCALAGYRRLGWPLAASVRALLDDPDDTAAEDPR